jgi:UDP-N-acetylglucosamine--N-acetylmuramyl-(pentapeptide) pyrophosphoryl-undecaprenol N-acetylglucosamine transferase
VIHFTGSAELAKELSQGYASHNIPARVKIFEEKMQIAWAAADAFIGRSGASTIAEAIEFEVPGVVIPFPFAADQHQDKNADFLVDGVGAGWKMPEALLTAENLSEKIAALFDHGQLAKFQKAMKNYKKRLNQMTLSELVLQLLP